MAAAQDGDAPQEDRNDDGPLNYLKNVSKGDVQKRLADVTQTLKKKMTTAADSVRKAAIYVSEQITPAMSSILGYFSSGTPGLNLVLFGRRGSEKTSAAKAILGQTDLLSPSYSSECVRNQGEVCGRWVSVVELPALKGKAQQEVMEESFRCISLCEPEGVHAFILVLPVGPLTDEDKGELQTIQDTFSSRVNDFTMILFTVDSDPTALDVNLIETDRDIKELLKSCGGRYVVLNIKDPKQIPELMETVETISNKGSRFFTNYMFNRVMIEKTLDEFRDFKQKSLKQGEDNRQSIEKLRKEIEDMKKREEEEKKKHTEEIEELKAQLEQKKKQKDEVVNETDDGQLENVTQASDKDNTGPMASRSLDCLRIVLIGKTGSGKSSSGNTILGKTEFKTEASPQSVTMKCQKAETKVDGHRLAVVDTPGLFDNNLSSEQVNEELIKCIDLLDPGPHVFLLVLPIGRLSPEDRETFTLIEEVLGENYEKFTIILFTKGDALKQDETSIEDYIEDACDDSCKKLISDCGGRYHVFENHDKKNRSQVTELIQKIDDMVKVNSGNCYTRDLLNDK